MPYALTNRQKEFLTYIQQYIAEIESSLRLEEIAANFYVSLPTAHNVLAALQS